AAMPHSRILSADTAGFPGSSDSPASTETELASGRRGVLSGATLALAAVVLLLWGIKWGVTPRQAIGFTLVVVLTQVLPGVVIWRAVRPRVGWWVEDVALGFAVGSGLAMAVQVPAGLLGWRWLSIVGPLLLAAPVVVAPALRRRVLRSRTSPLPWWWYPAVALTFLGGVPQLRGYFRMTPFHWHSGARALDVDTYFHLAVAGELADRGPLRYPWVDSEPLGYHYFAHAWMAQVGRASNIDLEVVLLRLTPLLMPVVVCLAVAVVAVRISGRAWTGPLAALLAMLPGLVLPFGFASTRLPMTPLSPTLGLSVPLLMALVALLVVRWRGEAQRGSWVLVPLLALAAAGTKGSSTPLLVAGAGLAAVAMMVFARRRALPVVVDAGLMLAGLIFALVVVFRASGEGLHQSFIEAAQQSPVGTVLGTDGTGTVVFDSALSVFASLALGMLGALVVVCTPWRRHPEGWLLAGGGGAGASAIAFFAHPGSSQGYFALSAIPLLSLVTVCGLAVAVDDWPTRRVGTVAVVGALAGVLAAWLALRLLGPVTSGGLARAGAAVLLGTGIIAVAVLAGVLLARQRRMVGGIVALGLTLAAAGAATSVDGLIQPPPAVAGPVNRDSMLAITMGQINAARWIRDHSDRLDLVMTNRHCVTPQNGHLGCDNRWFPVAAYSQRQVLVEGWTGTPRSVQEGPVGRENMTVPYWHPELLDLNDRFIARPTRADQQRLIKLGVRWVYVDFTLPHQRTLAPFATLRFQTRTAAVYELLLSGR
ncbi:MAG: hypothetical protein ABJA33_14170, partial [Pedococcus sp.]